MHDNVFIMIIIVQAVFWSTVFGISYIYITARNRERLALIEKGVDASTIMSKPLKNRYAALKWGLVAIFLGIGVFIGCIVGDTRIIPYEAAVISMPLIFGGLGLLVYYKIVPEDN